MTGLSKNMKDNFKLFHPGYKAVIAFLANTIFVITFFDCCIKSKMETIHFDSSCIHIYVSVFVRFVTAYLCIGICYYYNPYLFTCYIIYLILNHVLKFYDYV